MDLYLLKLTIRKKKPLRSFYVMTANMDSNTKGFYSLFGFGKFCMNISLAMGLGNHQRTGLDLGPSGSLRSDAWRYFWEQYSTGKTRVNFSLNFFARNLKNHAAKLA